MPKVYIAIGSNIEPEKNILAALELLGSHCDLKAVSNFYKTRPLSDPAQPEYLNGVCSVETVFDTPPRSFKFDLLRGIEDILDRKRTEDKFAPRTIDLDIIMFGDVKIEQPDLVIPDPDLLKRPFIYVPLLELDPNLKMPGEDRLISGLVPEADSQEMDVAKDFTQRMKERLQNQ